MQQSAATNRLPLQLLCGLLCFQFIGKGLYEVSKGLTQGQRQGYFFEFWANVSKSSYAMDRSSARVAPMPVMKIVPAKIKPQISNTESASVSTARPSDARRQTFMKDVKAAKSKRTVGSGSSLLLGPPPTAQQIRIRRMRSSLLRFLESKPVAIFMTVVTVYALFGDDIRLASAPVSADPAFFNVSFVVFLLYSIELLLSCVAKPNYLWSFYFWLDLVSTASVLVDVGWYAPEQSECVGLLDS
jgi:hypothetical protein